MTSVEQGMFEKLYAAIEAELEVSTNRETRRPMCALRSTIAELASAHGHKVASVEVHHADTIVVAIQEHPDRPVTRLAPEWYAWERGTEKPLAL